MYARGGGTPKDQPPKMSSIAYAYQSFYNGTATPMELWRVDFADKALAEVDRIRDLTDPVNRRKLRVLAENMVRNNLHDGCDDDVDEAIVQCYVSDSVESHEPLLAIIGEIVTPPIPA